MGNGDKGLNVDHPDVIEKKTDHALIGQIVKTDPISHIEDLHETMVSVIEDPNTESPNPDKNLIAALQEFSGKLQTVNRQEADFDQLVKNLFTEIDQATIGISAERAREHIEDSPEDEIREATELLAGDEYSELNIEHLENAVEDFIESLKNKDREPKTFIHDTRAYDVLTYFAATAGLIEYRSAQLIHDEFIEDRFREKQATWNLIQGQSGMTQEQRSQWLLRTGVIGNGLHGKIKNVKSMRNQLIHNPQAPNVIAAKPEEILTAGKEGLDAAHELTNMMSVDEKTNISNGNDQN